MGLRPCNSQNDTRKFFTTLAGDASCTFTCFHLSIGIKAYFSYSAILFAADSKKSNFLCVVLTHFFIELNCSPKHAKKFQIKNPKFERNFWLIVINLYFLQILSVFQRHLIWIGSFWLNKAGMDPWTKTKYFGDFEPIFSQIFKSVPMHLLGAPTKTSLMINWL